MNIYIKAMELGYNSPNGISYFDLVEEIEDSLKVKISGQTEYAFISWFLNNFSSVDVNRTEINTGLTGYIKSHLMSESRLNNNQEMFNKTLNNLFFINGETLKQYIDYEELTHARKSSKMAFILSIISIGIAGISSLLAFYSLYSEPVFEIVVKDNLIDSISATTNQIKIDKKVGDSIQILKLKDSID
jgi:hypothetical protein